ncbi:unnamed protein product [Rangifer tarandus platyrhynchus]|uniref:Uncharacterized protein n=3 Tax=Rangifer tarandus platyrhynchus TaxID=3082113 RepID=A0AC59YIL4_RANTA|nr:unnamed protein product [Rangifer tarandus platyrhynchus]CAI9696388.1 unnamed protein product [Rangifer tarandus platyrhynchus]
MAARRRGPYPPELSGPACCGIGSTVGLSGGWVVSVPLFWHLFASSSRLEPGDVKPSSVSGRNVSALVLLPQREHPKGWIESESER